MKIGENQFHLTGRNITDKEIIRQREEYERTHDFMTGYLNSVGWEKYCKDINQEKRADRKPQSIAIFYVDLAGVDDINTQSGHSAGDEYIVNTFHKITTECFRRNDIFIRIHSTDDELVVCLPNLNPEQLDIINLRLNAIRNGENPSARFYFGFAYATPDDDGNLNLKHTLDQADLQQEKDKKIRKGIK